jgi:protein-disulfide isomerase-like protein with CxxC motif
VNEPVEYQAVMTVRAIWSQEELDSLVALINRHAYVEGLRVTERHD